MQWSVGVARALARPAGVAGAQSEIGETCGLFVYATEVMSRSRDIIHDPLSVPRLPGAAAPALAQQPD